MFRSGGLYLDNLTPHRLIDSEIPTRIRNEGTGKLRQTGPASDMPEKAHEACVLQAEDNT